MPHMMMGFGPLEWIFTPETTYILIGWYDHYRRIFTDGRDWPKEIEPTYAGYSIGKWIDEDGDGRYDVLEVETRGFRGHRTPTTKRVCRVCRCILTTNRSSKSASTETRLIQTFFMTRGPSYI
jgi:hypothetical protein